MQLEGTIKKIIVNEKYHNNIYCIVLKEYPEEYWVTKMPIQIRPGDYVKIETSVEEKRYVDNFIIKGKKGGYIKTLKVYYYKKSPEPFLEFTS